MIVSHQNQFIFLKPQKTAGTTVELVLSKHCGPQDVITPFLFEPDPEIRRKNKVPEPQNFYRRTLPWQWSKGDVYRLFRYGMIPAIEYKEHHPAENIKLLVGDEVWSQYRKISVVRNPWDQAVSYYHWVIYRKRFTGSFEDYIKSMYKSYWHFLSLDDAYCIDIVIRFENLHEDLSKCLLQLNLPASDSIPNAKSSIRKDKSFRDMYSEETKELVRQKNAQLIERFGYSFD